MRKSLYALLFTVPILAIVVISQSQADGPNPDCKNLSTAGTSMTQGLLRTFVKTADPQVKKDLCGNELAIMRSQLRIPQISIDAIAKDYQLPVKSDLQSSAPILHSNPNATRKLFLDMDGYTFPTSSSDSAWLNNGVFDPYVGPGVTLTGIDLDGNPSTFSSLENAYITETWQYVVEHFSAFDVDVTTENPGVAGLTRSSQGDVNFGVTAVVSSDARWSNACGCGGIAYLWAVNRLISSPGALNYLGTSFNFNKFNVNSNYYSPARDLAGVIAHETGHNFGLQHDGTSTVEYYPGHSNKYWSAIMGTGWDIAVEHWSKNEYLGGQTRGSQGYCTSDGSCYYDYGNNDDFDIFQKNNIPLKPDDYGNSTNTSTLINTAVSRTVLSGIVGPNNDKDFFKFVLPVNQNISINAFPIANYPSLDILLKIYDSNGSVILSVNPEMSRGSDGKPLGMDARVASRAFTAGTYYLSVEGTGSGNPLNTGYSSYGSVGQYTFEVLVNYQAQATLSISNTTRTNAVGTSVTLTTAGGSGSGAVTYAVTGTNCTLTDATLGATAAASCVVTATKASDGTYAQAVSAPVTFTFLGAQATLSISNTTLTNPVGTAVTLTTTGGSGSGAVTYALSTPNASCSIRRDAITATAGTTCSVVATKAASGIYASATSNPVVFTFKGAQATLSISNTVVTNAVGSEVTITTTGGSGTGAIALAVTGTNCVLTENILTATGPASCVVSATKAQDSIFVVSNTATKNFTFLAAQDPLSITNNTLTHSTGTVVTLTSSGGSGTGAITYALSTANALCSLVGATVTASQPTQCSVTATKAAQGLYASKTSDPVVFTFKGPQATLTVSNTTRTNAVGTSVTLTTAGGSGSGAVTYAVTGTNCTLTDATLGATAAASCVVTATKASDGTYAQAVSAPVTFTFLGAQATLSISNTTLTNSVGTAVTLTTTGGSGSGVVTYALSTPNAQCSLRRNILTARAGTTCSVVATKAGDRVFAPIVSAIKNFIFN